MRRSMFVLCAALLCGPVCSRAARADDTAARRLEQTVIAGLPDCVTTTQFAALPVTATPLSDSLGTLVVPKSYLPTPTTEPQHDWTFSQITYLYRPPIGNAQRLLCRVHYTTPDDAALAARVARLLALAHRTLTAETAQAPANGNAPFDVWLCRGGQTGGEQWRTHLYLYDLDAPRSSIEWIREVVHEYSHLALPAIGGYADPEYWANGYLGERLLLRWFQRMPDGPARVERAWGDFSGAPNADRLLIAPAVALYARIGPSPKWVARTDAAGMRYLIGQALTFEDKHGARALGRAFTLLPRAHEAKAADFAAALAQAARGMGR